MELWDYLSEGETSMTERLNSFRYQNLLQREREARERTRDMIQLFSDRAEVEQSQIARDKEREIAKIQAKRDEAVEKIQKLMEKEEAAFNEKLRKQMNEAKKELDAALNQLEDTASEVHRMWKEKIEDVKNKLRTSETKVEEAHQNNLKDQIESREATETYRQDKAREDMTGRQADFQSVKAEYEGSIGAKKNVEIAKRDKQEEYRKEIAQLRQQQQEAIVKYLSELFAKKSAKIDSNFLNGFAKLVSELKEDADTLRTLFNTFDGYWSDGIEINTENKDNAKTSLDDLKGHLTRMKSSVLPLQKKIVDLNDEDIKKQLDKDVCSINKDLPLASRLIVPFDSAFLQKKFAWNAVKKSGLEKVVEQICDTIDNIKFSVSGHKELRKVVNGQPQLGD